jgi:hypothetical protein|tara:strand:- start:35 stop:832 length:798 start_codon:yes stop_codon:yes gene_type:complete
MVSGAISLLVSIGLLSGMLYLMQPSMVFFPSRDLSSTPSQWGLAYEDVTIDTADGIKLHGWFVPHQSSNEVLLFLHGNGGNISHRGESLRIFKRLGLNVLIIDYRGYGQSEGTPSEDGLYEDARSAWRYLAETRAYRAEQIILFGRSIGGAVAAKLVTEQQPAKVILESTFSSARDMASSLMPLLSKIVLLRYSFDSISHIGQLQAPLLMLHSPDDEIIPFELGEKLYQAANQPKQFVKLKGDHNYGFIQSQPDYERALAKFLRD